MTTTHTPDALGEFMVAVKAELEAMKATGMRVPPLAIEMATDRASMAEYGDGSMSVRDCADLLVELADLHAADVSAPQYLAHWGAGFVTPKSETVTLDFFSAYSGYDAEDIAAIAALAPGQTWQSSDFASHWVRRLGAVEIELVEYHTGGGCMALRADLPHAPGAYVLVADGDLQVALPSDPENGPLLIGAYNDDEPDGAMLTVQGREGLNAWYEEAVGYRPDDDAGTLLPIGKLMAFVAEMFYLHTYGDGTK